MQLLKVKEKERKKMKHKIQIGSLRQRHNTSRRSLLHLRVNVHDPVDTKIY